MNSWMVYGPFSLADANDGFVSFFYLMRTQEDHDYFWVLASTDDTTYYGYYATGIYDYNWKYVQLFLKDSGHGGSLPERILSGWHLSPPVMQVLQMMVSMLIILCSGEIRLFLIHLILSVPLMVAIRIRSSSNGIVRIESRRPATRSTVPPH